jgi:hypothetical protein
MASPMTQRGLFRFSLEKSATLRRIIWCQTDN